MYYYLVASLPMLTFGGKPPFSSSRYLFSSQGILTKPHEDELRALLAGDPIEHPTDFTRSWISLETQLRNAVAKYRGSKTGIESKPYLKQYGEHSVRVQEEIAEALAKQNPLERERELDRIRWSILDDLAAKNRYGIDDVFAYGLQLQILERWTAMTDEAGWRKVNDIVNNVSI